MDNSVVTAEGKNEWTGGGRRGAENGDGKHKIKLKT